MEITYDTGAKVILQGPATYEVESNGGFLLVGKLTGKLEKRREERQRDEGTNYRLIVSIIIHPSSVIPSASALPPPLSPTWAPISVLKLLTPAPPKPTSSWVKCKSPRSAVVAAPTSTRA